MKSTAEIKFDSILKNGFHEILKPLGFRKKGNNFYSQKDGIGHMINIQKSIYNAKHHIHFTINASVFLPEFWSVCYNYFNRPVPDFPTEPECILRKRIGELRDESDKWYEVTDDSDPAELSEEMKKNVTEYILPHFGRVLTKDMLIDHLDKQTDTGPMEKLIVFGELGELTKAKEEFDRIVSDATRNPAFLQTVRDYGKKYGIL